MGVFCLSLLSVTLGGCGNVLYTARANDASSRIEEARLAGAEERALYEYTLAKQHLAKAMTEASEADYGDAYELAGLARDYAEQALEKTKAGGSTPVVPALKAHEPASSMSVHISDGTSASPATTEPSE
jgi:hypothetical protein